MFLKYSLRMHLEILCMKTLDVTAERRSFSPVASGRSGWSVATASVQEIFHLILYTNWIGQRLFPTFGSSQVMSKPPASLDTANMGKRT